MALPLPELEGKYEVLQKIREGGMGAIYKVRHRLLHEVRVIKVMRPSLDEDDELRAVDRFVREARIAIKLRHPNIAQLYDFSSDQSGNGFIVMEFIDGLNLDDILKNSGPPSVSLAVEIATQSLEALGTLHESGFVHRDISPDNLMLTRDLRGRSLVKLIDLGIAKLVQSDEADGVTKTGTFLGKYKYAPPEMFQDAAGSGVDNRSDLYSFGIVLYKFLTNEHPITGSDVSSVIAGHLFREPLSFDESDPEGKVPQELRDIVLKALAKKPEDRYQNAEEMVAALEGMQESLSLEENPDEVQALMDLRDRLREEAAAKIGTGTQAGIDDLFPAGSTQAPAGDDATVMLTEATADAEGATQMLAAVDSGQLQDGATQIMPSPAESAGAGSDGSSPAVTRKFNPLLAVAAVVGGLLLVLLIVLATRGGGDEPTAAAAATGDETPSTDTTDDSVSEGSAVEIADQTDPLPELVETAVAAMDAGDVDQATERLTEIDAILTAEEESGATARAPELVTRIAVLREQVLNDTVAQITDSLQAAVAKADRATLDSTLSQLTPQQEQALTADPERARILSGARAASTAMARFERALNSSEPERALAIAFELASAQPGIARSLNAKERAARAVENRIDQQIGRGELAEARRSAEALRDVWPDRPRLRERAQRIARMSNASQTAQGIFQEAEMTIAAGEPHVGLEMLEGRQIPAPFRARAEQLMQRLREDLSRRDRRVPQFAPLDEKQDVEFDRGNPAVIQLNVTDDYMVVGVQARARNEKDELMTVAAVPMGDGVYRVSVPPEFHGNEPFHFWALAVDQSRNEGRLGASNRPIEIRRKRRFRRGRG